GIRDRNVTGVQTCALPIFPPPPRAIERIIVFACSNRSSSPLISLTVVPEPRAIRERREPLMIFGLARSAGVIDCTIASMRVTSRSEERRVGEGGRGGREGR